jgi:hypothetical protein
MATHFTKKDIERIVYLKDTQGKSHREIAEELGRFDKDGQPNARAIMKQYVKATKSTSNLTLGDELPQATSEVEPPTEQRGLNEMSRKERLHYIQAALPSSARGRFVYNDIFDNTERELFEEEYFSILKEEDSMTAAEEQQLFMAIIHYVMAMRAMKRDKECYNKSVQGGYNGPNSVLYTDQWTREYHENMKKYDTMMKSLKLSREQRLKDMQRMGTSFLDFAERVAKTTEQEKIADEILKLEKASAEELGRLASNGWIIGGGLPDNSQFINKNRRK